MSRHKQEFTKNYRPLLKKKAKNSFLNNYGKFGLRALNSGYINYSQIEIIKSLCLKFVKDYNNNSNILGKRYIVWLHVYPSIFITSKGSEARIGGGKGSPKLRVARVSAGQVLIEFSLDSDAGAKKLLNLISVRLPIKVCLIRSFDF
jgi:large subunit ribosomal protein L16|uniref:50S ribosomal protein L16 n=1 Tax=Cyanidiaceae sp. MX-AZ01 TaxID=1503164 RepID=A0A060A8C2_9RHOD|nr:50S ribosomal protein L16 [Cyanidiaceae sp. MX-AZ01]